MNDKLDSRPGLVSFFPVHIESRQRWSPEAVGPLQDAEHHWFRLTGRICQHGRCSHEALYVLPSPQRAAEHYQLSRHLLRRERPCCNDARCLRSLGAFLRRKSCRPGTDGIHAGLPCWVQRRDMAVAHLECPGAGETRPGIPPLGDLCILGACLACRGFLSGKFRLATWYWGLPLLVRSLGFTIALALLMDMPSLQQTTVSILFALYLGDLAEVRKRLAVNPRIAGTHLAMEGLHHQCG